MYYRGSRLVERIVFLALVAVIAGASWLLYPSKDAEQTGLIVTPDKYASIQTGMSYEEVVQVLGEEGTEHIPMSRIISDSGVLTYAWRNPDGVTGMTARFSTRTGRLLEKSKGIN